MLSMLSQSQLVDQADDIPKQERRHVRRGTPNLTNGDGGYADVPRQAHRYVRRGTPWHFIPCKAGGLSIEHDSVARTHAEFPVLPGSVEASADQDVEVRACDKALHDADLKRRRGRRGTPWTSRTTVLCEDEDARRIQGSMAVEEDNSFYGKSLEDLRSTRRGTRWHKKSTLWHKDIRRSLEAADFRTRSQNNDTSASLAVRRPLWKSTPGRGYQQGDDTASTPSQGKADDEPCSYVSATPHMHNSAPCDVKLTDFSDCEDEDFRFGLDGDEFSPVRTQSLEDKPPADTTPAWRQVHGSAQWFVNMKDFCLDDDCNSDSDHSSSDMKDETQIWRLMQKSTLSQRKITVSSNLYRNPSLGQVMAEREPMKKAEAGMGTAEDESEVELYAESLEQWSGLSAFHVDGVGQHDLGAPSPMSFKPSSYYSFLLCPGLESHAITSEHAAGMTEDNGLRWI